jgi:hypothetical protein
METITEYKPIEGEPTKVEITETRVQTSIVDAPSLISQYDTDIEAAQRNIDALTKDRDVTLENYAARILEEQNKITEYGRRRLEEKGKLEAKGIVTEIVEESVSLETPLE